MMKPWKGFQLPFAGFSDAPSDEHGSMHYELVGFYFK